MGIIPRWGQAIPPGLWQRVIGAVRDSSARGVRETRVVAALKEVVMWMLYGKVRMDNIWVADRKVCLRFHTRTDAVKESRWYWNTHGADWTPHSIMYESWRLP